MDPIPPIREPQICPLREMLDFPLRETQKGLLIKGNTKINNIVFHPVIELPIQQNAQRFLRQYLSRALSLSLGNSLNPRSPLRRPERARAMVPWAPPTMTTPGQG